MAKATITPIVNLGTADAIPLGQGRCYVVGNLEIAVFRQRDGALFATQNRCPHRQGPLSEGLLGSGTIICPLHAHQFNLETGCGGETEECLDVYGVEELNGNIVVSLERNGSVIPAENQ